MGKTSQATLVLAISSRAFTIMYFVNVYNIYIWLIAK